MSITRFVILFAIGPAWSVWWVYRGIEEQRWAFIALGVISLICFSIAGYQMARKAGPSMPDRSE